MGIPRALGHPFHGHLDSDFPLIHPMLRQAATQDYSLPSTSFFEAKTTLSGAELERCLFPPAPTVPSNQRPMPDWAWAHAEFHRPSVTLALLWQEYRLSQPQGFQYSWFCEHYRLWAAKIDVVMRQP